MIKKILLLSPFFYFVILPFIHIPGLIDPYELPKVLFFISFTFILIGLYVWRMLTYKTAFVKFQKTHFFILSIIIIYTISSIINSSLSISFFGQYFRYQGLITQVSYFLFFVLFTNLEGIGLTNTRLAKNIALGGLFLSFLIITQAFIYKILLIPIYNYNGRLAGFLGNPNFAGGFLTLSFIYLSFSPFKKIPLVFSWLIFFSALLLTDSRSAIITFLFVSIVLFIGKVNKKVFLVPVFLLFALIIFLVALSRPVSTFENRTVIWNKAISASLEKPIFGWGLDNFAVAFQSVLGPNDFDLKKIRVDKTHNEFLEILLSGGILALLIYILILLDTIKTLWKNRKDAWPKTNLLALIAFLILAQFNVLNITEYIFFYLILSVLIVPLTNK